MKEVDYISIYFSDSNCYCFSRQTGLFFHNTKLNWFDPYAIHNGITYVWFKHKRELMSKITEQYKMYHIRSGIYKIVKKQNVD